MAASGYRDVDHVLTTREAAAMVHSAGIDLPAVWALTMVAVALGLLTERLGLLTERTVSATLTRVTRSWQPC
jgi:iron only hydrogenase large subunit-like protein